jgi:hypothetical protein
MIAMTLGSLRLKGLSEPEFVGLDSAHPVATRSKLLVVWSAVPGTQPMAHSGAPRA